MFDSFTENQTSFFVGMMWPLTIMTQTRFMLFIANDHIIPTKNEVRITMDYLRMDGKRGHVTCGNRLAIERQESFQKFASLQEELLLPSARPVGTLQDFAWLDMGKNDSSSIK